MQLASFRVKLVKKHELVEAKNPTFPVQRMEFKENLGSIVFFERKPWVSFFFSFDGPSLYIDLIVIV
jgi:hypothetical protein